MLLLLRILRTTSTLKPNSGSVTIVLRKEGLVKCLAYFLCLSDSTVTTKSGMRIKVNS
jgi:hypothetical protein